MPRAIDKTCSTCRVPTQAALNSTVCAGFRSREDGVVHKPRGECPTWKVAAETWSVAEAQAYAAFMETPMSRPTVIKKCIDIGACRRKPGSVHWRIDAAKFKSFLNGCQECLP